VRARAGDVHTLSVEEGELSAHVGACVVTLRAERIPSRVWSTVARAARRRESVEAGVAGREQSVHLEHTMRFEWDEPLIPDRQSLSRTCTCDGEVACEHVAAVAYVVADLIDQDPSLLLRWRGCREIVEPEPAAEPVALPASDEPWEAGALPPARPLRPLPAGAVLKSLGASGIRAGAGDVADILQRAYASFARR
jgi:hypothetical protein